MPQATSARALLRRIHPWLGRAVHVKWTRHRSLYQRESEALLMDLARVQGAVPRELALRLEGFLGHLHKEWFPKTWRRAPCNATVSPRRYQVCCHDAKPRFADRQTKLHRIEPRKNLPQMIGFVESVY
jgi:hypothetical protein